MSQAARPNNRSAPSPAPPRPPAGGGVASWVSAAILALFVVILVVAFALRREPGARGDFNIESFGALPVVYEGRSKPFDTVARNALLIVSSRSYLKDGDQKVSASQWLLDVLARPEVAADYPVFRIDNDGVKQGLNLTDTDRKRYTYREIIAREAELAEMVRQAAAIPEDEREVAEQLVLELRRHLDIYESLMAFSRLHLVPPAEQGADWTTLYQTVDVTAVDGPLPPTLDLLRRMSRLDPAQMPAFEQTLKQEGRALGRIVTQEMITAFVQARQAGARVFNDESRAVVSGYQRLFDAYANQNAEAFNDEVRALGASLADSEPEAAADAAAETFLNRSAPFTISHVLYIAVMLVVFLSWVFARTTLMRSANLIVVVALLIHTGGLLLRMVVSGYAPVTNLYSSAVFIGWGCVAVALVIELIFRNSFGTLVGCVVGFLTLQVSSALGTDGDTIGVMRAVLDSNFWLSTHVTTITLGYVAMFLAGFFAILYIGLGLLTPLLDRALTKTLGQIIYGVICFAVLLSFIGTVLGGIWADQSWGRFWGWDPKENGAVLIVLCSALILHARWAGIIRQRGLAVLAVFGNIVTAWSWFGTNMLGAGLHAYGFIDGSLGWMFLFLLSQFVAMNLGLRPDAAWLSRAFHPLGRPKPAGALAPSFRFAMLHTAAWLLLLLGAYFVLFQSDISNLGSWLLPPVVIGLVILRRWSVYWMNHHRAQSGNGALIVRLATHTVVTILLLVGMVICVYFTDRSSTVSVILAVFSVSIVTLLAVAGEIASWATVLYASFRQRDLARTVEDQFPVATVPK